jgi:Zn-dependent oligopeptidase
MNLAWPWLPCVESNMHVTTNQSLASRKQLSDEHRQKVAQIRQEMSQLQRQHNAKVAALTHNHSTMHSKQTAEMGRLRVQLQATREQYLAVAVALEQQCATLPECMPRRFILHRSEL